MPFYLTNLRYQVVDPGTGQQGWDAPVPSLGNLALAPLSAWPVSPTLGQLGPPAFIHTQTAQPSLSSQLLGNSINSPLTVAQRTAVGTFIGLPPGALVGGNSTILDTFWSALTAHADPAGLTRFGPIMPTRALKMQFAMGGVGLVHEEDFNNSVHHRVLLAIREQYRAIRANTLAGIELPDTHRKALFTWVRKFHMPHTNFIPPGLPNESPIPPGSIHTENFGVIPRPNLGPQLPWSEVLATWEVVVNAGDGEGTSSTAALSRARADVDVGGDDMFCEGEVRVTGSTAATGFGSRFAPAADTAYWAGLRDGGLNNDDLFRIIANIFFRLASQGAAHALPHMVRSESDGTTIRMYKDGVPILSQVDVGIPNGQRGGIEGFGVTLSRLDDFLVRLIVEAGGVRSGLSQKAIAAGLI